MTVLEFAVRRSMFSKENEKGIMHNNNNNNNNIVPDFRTRMTKSRRDAHCYGILL